MTPNSGNHTYQHYSRETVFVYVERSKEDKHTEKLCTLSSSTNGLPTKLHCVTQWNTVIVTVSVARILLQIIWVVKSVVMKWVGNVARMGSIVRAYRITM